MIQRSEKICPRCDAPRLKSWGELNDEEKDMIERLGIMRSGREERKKHRYCTRCWFSSDSVNDIA